MKKLFVVADVHSYYDIFKKALDDACFDINNEDHILISCGDLCDRGSGSKEILNYFNNLDYSRKICIIGNHELLMEDLITRGDADIVDFSNGTIKTVEQLTDIYGHVKSAIMEMNDNSYWKKYKNSWRWYFEIDKYIFVHGYIPTISQKVFNHIFYNTYNPDWRNADVKDFENATWLNGMETWSYGVKENNKTIVCGHWHTSWGHCHIHNDGDEFIDENNPNSYAIFNPFIDDGIICLDAATAYSNQINVLTIDIDDEEYNRYFH